MMQIFIPELCVLLLLTCFHFAQTFLIGYENTKAAVSLFPLPSIIALLSFTSFYPFSSSFFPVALQNTMKAAVEKISVLGKRLDQSSFHASSVQNVQSYNIKGLLLYCDFVLTSFTPLVSCPPGYLLSRPTDLYA